MTAPASRHVTSFGRAARYYTIVAVILFNTALLFVLLNLIFFYIFKVYDRIQSQQASHPSNLVYDMFGEGLVANAYPGMSKPDLDGLLHETWSRPYSFEPLIPATPHPPHPTLYREQPFVGKWVNVDEHGFRRSKNQGPWPPDPRNLNIFIFGGSTTFGYGVGDEQTIASYLQEFLQRELGRDVRAYNFAVGAYTSVHERLQFEKLLAASRPHAAIFIDGINDFAKSGPPPEMPVWPAPEAEQPECFETAWKVIPVPSKALLVELPLKRAADVAAGFVKRGTELPTKKGPSPDQRVKSSSDESSYNDPVFIATTIETYSRNKRLIESVAKVHAVTPVFVWQPTPAYKYDLTYHPFASFLASADFSFHMLARYGYPVMARVVREKADEYGKNFLWLADVQQDVKRGLYVDPIHYSAAFMKELAAMIGQGLIERKLLKEGGV